MMLPKLVITDIDGVWTDGGMYYDQTGNEWKKFNTSDSVGVLFLRLLDIPLAIITGENTGSIRRRAEKLEIEYLFCGISDKVAVAQKLIDKLGLQWSELAYIGDDLNDIPLLQKVGLSASPANSAYYVSKYSDVVLKKSGGGGAFREFVENILIDNQLMDEAIDRYFKYLSKKGGFVKAESQFSICK